MHTSAHTTGDLTVRSESDHIMLRNIHIIRLLPLLLLALMLGGCADVPSYLQPDLMLPLDGERQISVMMADSGLQPLWEEELSADAIVFYEQYGLVRASFSDASEQLYFRSRYGKQYFTTQHAYRKTGNAEYAMEQMHKLMLTAHEGFLEQGWIKRHVGVFGEKIDTVLGDLLSLFVGVGDGWWGRFTGVSHRMLLWVINLGIGPRALLTCLFLLALLISAAASYRSYHLVINGKMEPYEANLLSGLIYIFVASIPFLVVGGELAAWYCDPDMTFIVNLERCYGADTTGLAESYLNYRYVSCWWLVLLTVGFAAFAFWAILEVSAEMMTQKKTKAERDEASDKLVEDAQEPVQKTLECLLVLVAAALLPYDFVLFIFYCIVIRMIMPIYDYFSMLYRWLFLEPAQTAHRPAPAPAPKPAPQGAKQTRIPALYDRLLRCNGGNCLSADGRLALRAWPDGAMQVGMVSEGKFNGMSILITKEGDHVRNFPGSAFFVGPMKDGIIEGEQCTCYAADGHLTYYGPVRDRKPVDPYPVSDGYAKYRFEVSLAGRSGKEYGYIGETCDGVGKGWGILLFADGSISFGRMIDGHPRPGSEIGFTDCGNLRSEIFPAEE